MASTSPARAARRTGTPTLGRVGALALAGVAVTALAGCGSSVPTRLDFSDTEKVEVTEVVLAGGSGDVVVRTAAIAETRVKRTVSYRGRQQPTATYRLTGTVLTVDTDCGGDCSVSYDVEVPAGVAVRGTLGSGNVTLANVATADVEVRSGNVEVTGASGAVQIRTRSGDISVRDVAGVTALVATSGNIAGTGLGGAAVTAEATSGDIDLTLGKPGPVTAKATSGDVSVLVPPGAYRVRASAKSGDRRVAVTDDPTAKHLLDVAATSGNVTVAPA